MKCLKDDWTCALLKFCTNLSDSFGVIRFKVEQVKIHTRKQFHILITCMFQYFNKCLKIVTKKGFKNVYNFFYYYVFELFDLNAHINS